MINDNPYPNKKVIMDSNLSINIFLKKRNEKIKRLIVPNPFKISFIDALHNKLVNTEDIEASISNNIKVRVLLSKIGTFHFNCLDNIFHKVKRIIRISPIVIMPNTLTQNAERSPTIK